MKQMGSPGFLKFDIARVMSAQSFFTKMILFDGYLQTYEFVLFKLSLFFLNIGDSNSFAPATILVPLAEQF